MICRKVSKIGNVIWSYEEVQGEATIYVFC